MAVLCRAVALEAEAHLATQLTDFRVFTLLSFSVLLEPCVGFCGPVFVVLFFFLSDGICHCSCLGIVLVAGRMRHCVRVQATVTAALHRHWLLCRAAVAVLEAGHYRSLAPRSGKINMTLLRHSRRMEKKKKKKVNVRQFLTPAITVSWGKTLGPKLPVSKCCKAFWAAVGREKLPYQMDSHVYDQQACYQVTPI